MKNAIIGFGMLMIMLFTALTGVALNQDSSIKNNVTSAVDTGTMNALQDSFNNGTDIKDTFENKLKDSLGNLDGIIIEYKAADATMGILSVKVTKQYKNFGNARTVEYSRCVIREG